MSAEVRRKHLSVQQKLEIVAHLEKGMDIKELCDEYGVVEKTIRNMVKKKEDLIKLSLESPSGPSTKKVKKFTYDDLDKVVLDWVSEHREKVIQLTGPLFIQQTKVLFKKLGVEGTFYGPAGWLVRFKQAHGHVIRFHQDKPVRDPAVEFYDKFRQFIQADKLTTEQIYSAEATGLYWKCLPSKSSSLRQRSGDERIALLCCSNVSGTHKLKLTVVGNMEITQVFKGANPFHLPIQYYYQENALVNKIILAEWFHNTFVPNVRDYLKKRGLPENGVLLLDGVYSLLSDGLLQTRDGRFCVKYLPENVTTSLHPSVAIKMKRYYRLNLLHKYADEGLIRFRKQFKISGAVNDIALAWNAVKPSTLTRTWLKIFPGIVEDADGYDSDKDEVTTAELAEVANEVPNGEKVGENDIAEWLNCDKSEMGYEVIMKKRNSATVTNGISKSPVENNMRVDEDQQLPPNNKISHDAALCHINSLLDYLETEEVNESDKLVFHRIRSNIQNKVDSAKIPISPTNGNK